jgi:hypothetical protein
MLRRIGLLTILALLIGMTDVVLAQDPVTPLQSDPAWAASYWNNTTLSGEPALQRSEVAVNHDWGTGSPPNISPDRFSARWTRYIDLSAGVYRFTATSDDGVRVWVDGDLIINEWYDHPAKAVSVEKALEAGLHLVEVEYYENGGLATVKLAWLPLSPTLDRWQASYWNNTTHAGSPILQRSEVAVNHDWGTGSPDPSILSDGFSARWVRVVELSAGTYHFTATSDDGVRVWVDNELIINEWSDHPARTYSGEKHLSSGAHWVVIEYYENFGLASIELSWRPVSGPSFNWQGEYFDNATVSGRPALVRTDEAINFAWGSFSPAPGLLGTDRFSVRWTQNVNLPAGRYRFAMTVDDGGRLWVNNHLLIESWRDQPATTYTGDIHLPGGPIPVRMEYYENGGSAEARLSWTRIDAESGPVTVVEDDAHTSFVKGGIISGWRTAPEGYGGSLTWTWNNDRERPNYNWARWNADLMAGRYEVQVYIPQRYTTTANARYWINHANGSTLVTVDQSANGGRWVSLGTYDFNGTANEYVTLSDITFEAPRSRLIAFDAIKWIPR